MRKTYGRAFRWVHLTYTNDLIEMGFSPMERNGSYARFSLPAEDWRAFSSMYNPEPVLYEMHPEDTDRPQDSSELEINLEAKPAPSKV